MEDHGTVGLHRVTRGLRGIGVEVRSGGATGVDQITATNSTEVSESCDAADQFEFIALIELHRGFNEEADRTEIAREASLDSPLALVIVTGII